MKKEEKINNMTYTLLIIASYEAVKWILGKIWDKFINND
jgi:hypothetical protein